MSVFNLAQRNQISTGIKEKGFAHLERRSLWLIRADLA